jgi:thioredoxin 1
MADLNDIMENFTNVNIQKINIMENYDLTEKYNVRSVPTLVLLKDSESKASYIGYKGKEDLIKFLTEHV